jgi:hypothetical protein
LTEGLDKTTENFSWDKWYSGQDLGTTDERRYSWKDIFTTKTVTHASVNILRALNHVLSLFWLTGSLRIQFGNKLGCFKLKR